MVIRMKICKGCKAEIEDNQNFCHICGSNEFESLQNTIPQENYVNIPNESSPAPAKKRNKTGLKIFIIIITAIVVVALALGVVSIVNYSKNKPYLALIDELTCQDFYCYEEYEELLYIEFDYSHYGSRNFIEKALNIYDFHEIEFDPHAYMLYSEEDVDGYEELKDLIAFDDTVDDGASFSRLGTLLIDENGTYIVVTNDDIEPIEIISEDGKITSLIMNDGYNEISFSGANSLEPKLVEKFSAMITEYEEYHEREENSSDILSTVKNHAIENDLFDGDAFYQKYNVSIQDFIDNCWISPEVEIHADRLDENIYYVYINGECMFFTSDNYFLNPTFTLDSGVTFIYDESDDTLYCYNDSNSAFFYYSLSYFNRSYY